jgi:hypothetical protein
MISEHGVASRHARESGSRSRDDHPMMEDRSGGRLYRLGRPVGAPHGRDQ